jgi:photosystem II stability/assembly factor-like uncharacterized protein
LLAVAVTVSVVGTTSSAFAATRSHSLESAATVTVATGSGLGIACPSKNSCFVIASANPSQGAITNTTDGGRTWALQTVPSGTGDLSGIACPSTSTCYAVGATYPGESGAMIIGTTDGGAEWGSLSLPSGLGPLRSIACPSESTCYAASQPDSNNPGFVLATTDGGTTWNTQTVPPSPGNGFVGLGDIACTSPTVCYVVGGFEGPDTSASVRSGKVRFQPPVQTPLVDTTVNGGSTWSETTDLPSLTQNLSVIACPNSNDCYVTAEANGSFDSVLITANAGRTWALKSFPNFGAETTVRALACQSSTICYAGGAAGRTKTANYALHTTTAAKSWTVEKVPGLGGFAALDCPTKSICYAPYGDKIDITKNSGTLWTAESDLS